MEPHAAAYLIVIIAQLNHWAFAFCVEKEVDHKMKYEFYDR